MLGDGRRSAKVAAAETLLEEACLVCLSPHAFSSLEGWAAEICRRMNALLGMEKSAVLFAPTVAPRAVSNEFPANVLTVYLERHYLKTSGERERWRRNVRYWTRDELYLDAVGLRRTSYWNEVIVPHRYFDACGCAERLTADTEALFYAGRERERSIAANGREKAILKRVQPFFAAGMRYVTLRAEAGTGLLKGVDATGGALLVADGKGRMIHATPAWLDEESALPERDRRELRLAALRIAGQVLVGGNRLGTPPAPVSRVATALGDYTVAATSATGVQYLSEEYVLVSLSCPPGDTRLVRLAARRFRLTRRQTDVAGLLLEGCSAREIADRLAIAHNTARRHIEALYDRLGVRGFREAAHLLRSLSG